MEGYLVDCLGAQLSVRFGLFDQIQGSGARNPAKVTGKGFSLLLPSSA